MALLPKKTGCALLLQTICRGNTHSYLNLAMLNCP